MAPAPAEVAVVVVAAAVEVVMVAVLLRFRLAIVRRQACRLLQRRMQKQLLQLIRCLAGAADQKTATNVTLT